MKTTYIDSNGNLVTPSSSGSSGNTYTYIDDNGNLASAEVPIAPVSSKKKKKKNNWINLGAFDDGYDFGDVTKSILGTSQDVGKNLFKGAMSAVEGINDAGAQLIGAGAHLVGAEKAANKLKKYAAKETFTDDNFLTKFLLNSLPSNGIGRALNLADTLSGNKGSQFVTEQMNKNIEKTSVLGDSSRGIAQGVGQLGGQVALQSLGVPWQVTAFTGAASNEIENAFQNDSTYGQAFTSGLISGLSEVGSEYLSGGANKFLGMTSLGSKFIDKLGGKITNKALSRGLKTILDVGGEGGEEIISGLGTAIGRKLTYMSDKDFKEIYSSEQALDDFIGGALVTAIAGVPGNVRSIARGENAFTGLTENEQKVIDKELENRVKEAEKDGKELSKKQINEIENEVRTDFENGKLIKNTLVSNKSGINELQNNTENGIYQYVKSDNAKIDNLRKDVSTLNWGNTEQTNNYVKMLEQIIKDKDVEIRFDSNLKDSKGNVANGKYENGVITINPNSNRAGEFIAIHELTHAIGTDSMRNIVNNYMKSNAEFKKAVNELLAKTYNTNELTDEAMADVAGQLFGNQEFINNLAQNNPSVFKTLYNNIKYLWHQFRGYKNQSQFIEDLQWRWEQAYRNNKKLNQTQNNSNVEMSNQVDDYGEKLSLEQAKYFKNSKIRNDNGNLKTLFHGTPNYDFNEFEGGTFLTDDYMNADGYASGERVIESYVNMEKPLIIDCKGAKWDNLDTPYGNSTGEVANNLDESKYDGIIFENVNDAWYDDENGDIGTVYYVPNSNQIKETNNLNPSKSPDIRYSKVENDGNLEYNNEARPDFGNSLEGQEWYDFYKKIDNNGIENKQPGSKNRTIINDKIILSEHDGTRPNVYKVYQAVESSNEIAKKFNMTTEDIIQDIYEIAEEANVNEREIENYLEKYFDKGLLRRYDSNNNEFIGRDKETRTDIEPNNRSIGEQQRGQDSLYETKQNRELDNSSFSLDKNAKRYEDLQKTNYIDYFVKDNGDVRVNLMDSNNNLVNQFDVYNQREAINQLGEELGKQIYQTSSVDNQRFDLGNDINNMGSETDYFMTHRPTETGAYASDISNNGDLMPTDVYEHPEYYYNMDKSHKESFEVLKKIRNNPNAEITIYRATPGDKINKGDWITLSKTYAEQHNQSQFDGKANILEKKVKAKDIQFAGDDINEFGYYPNMEKYSKQNKSWQEYLENNFKSTGTKTNMKDLKQIAPVKETKTEAKENKQIAPIKKNVELPKNPTKESSYDNEVVKRTRKQVQEDLKQKMDIKVEDLDVGKDISSIDFQRTDPIRLNEKVFGYKVGNKINDETIRKTKHNEAERTRFLNKERQEIKDLGIKPRSAESAAVQKYGEKQYVTDKGTIIPYGDVELAAEFPNVETQKKIKEAAKVLRDKYDTYIEDINRVITDMGYDPIPKRKDYMRHFQEINDKLSEWGVPLNPTDMSKDTLPTDINGVTDQFKPGKNWFASAMQRKGFKTTYDAITGIDGYLEGASNLIYHTGDIQRYRTLSKMIRETYGQQHGMDNLDVSTKEGQKRLNDIMDNKLSKYAAWLDEQANALAGKKGGIDRAAERLLGRKVYTVLDTAKKQVGSNMTGFNVRSALTNFASAVQGASKTNKLAFVKGTVSTLKNMIHNDGLINKSDFLTSRFGSDQLSKKLWQKASNAGQIFMTGTDYFTANQIWRSKYYENLSKGMSETQAIKNADDFASRIMGDRSKGSTAEIFNSKTLGLLTQFQLEVNNQWSSIIHDNKMDIKSGNKSGATVMFQLGQLAAMSYMFNNFMRSLTGSDVMIDPIDMLKKILGKDDDDDDKTVGERATEVIGDLLDDLPFASFMTGGRVPMSEAFTGLGTTFKKVTGQKDKYGNDITWGDVKDDVISSGAYWLLPTGYGQLKKTTKGLSMYDENLPMPGSYTDSGNLRFRADESTGGKIKAALFGQYSSEEAQKYMENGYKTVDKRKLDELKELNFPTSKYIKYKEELSKAGKSNAEKLEYLNSTDKYTDEEKNIMYKDILELKDDELNKMDEIMNVETQNEYMYTKTMANKIKRDTSLTSDERKDQIVDMILETDLNDEQLAYLYSKFYTKEEKMQDILNAGIPIKEYIKFDSQDFEGEFDENKGRTKTNSKKNEVINYINNLNLSIPQKAFLIKSKYSSFKQYDTVIEQYIQDRPISLMNKYRLIKEANINAYDGEIVNYINNQSMTTGEKEELLKSMGFTIHNGRVYFK